jgi:hypothetical protein
MYWGFNFIARHFNITVQGGGSVHLFTTASDRLIGISSFASGRPIDQHALLCPAYGLARF